MIRLLYSYIWWHYTRALRDGFKTFINFEWFAYHFFSVPVLYQTFFEKFGRRGEEYKKGLLNLKDNSAAFIANTLMRLVGMVVRGATLVAWLIVAVCIVALALLLLTTWILYPIILIFLLLIGLNHIL